MPEDTALGVPLIFLSTINHQLSTTPMAASKTGTMIAFPAEVARYLLVESEDIERMITSDKLPATRVMKTTRRVYRIPLREFHAWLMDRTVNPRPGMGRFETFLKDFDATARSGKKLRIES